MFQNNDWLYYYYIWKTQFQFGGIRVDFVIDCKIGSNFVISSDRNFDLIASGISQFTYLLWIDDQAKRINSLQFLS